MTECSMTLSGFHSFRKRPWGGTQRLLEVRCWCGLRPAEAERAVVEEQLGKTKQMLERQTAEEGGTAGLYPVSGTQERLL